MVAMVYKKLVGRFIHLVIVCQVLFSCAANNQSSESAYVVQKQYVPVRTYYPKEYNSYNQPHSRQYNNPYAYPPQNYYPYYDSDQYYIPPSGYHNYEQDNYYRNGAGKVESSVQNADAVGGKY